MACSRARSARVRCCSSIQASDTRIALMSPRRRISCSRDFQVCAAALGRSGASSESASRRIPQGDDTTTVGVANDVEGGNIQLQPGRDSDLGVDPPHRDRTQDVAMGKRDEPRVCVPSREGDELLRPRVNLLWGLASRRAVFVQLPVRIRFMDLFGGQSFVTAIVHFLQQRRDLQILKAGELGGAPGALHRARVNSVELDATEPLTQGPGLVLAAWGEGQIGGAGVPPRETPLRLAVAGEVDLERQAGLPIISGRPERSDRLALSMTAPPRTRRPGRTQTSPTAPWAPRGLTAPFTAAPTPVGAGGGAA